jgi:hypothetical protein
LAQIPSSVPIPFRLLVVAAAGGGVLLAGTLALWVYYGSTVFYEMIVAGIAACF